MWHSDVADKISLRTSSGFFFYSYSRFFRVQPVQIHFQKKRVFAICRWATITSSLNQFYLFLFFRHQSITKNHPDGNRRIYINIFFSDVDAFSLTPLPCWNTFSPLRCIFSLFCSFENVRSTYDTFFCVLWRRSTTIRLFCGKKNLRSVLARDTIRSLPYFPPNTFFCVHIIRNCFFFWLSLFRALTESIGGSSGFAHEDWWWRQ